MMRNQADQQKRLETVELSWLKPYKRNPRCNEQAVQAVAESIRQCGYVAPIVADEDGNILAGHTRYQAMKLLHWRQASVLIQLGLTEEQKRKYRLLDNKTGELAEWNFDLLADELEDLDFDDLELDWGIETDQDYGESFELPSGDRDSDCTMRFTLAQNQKEEIEEALALMKQSTVYASYTNPENANSNGNALYLMIVAWRAGQ